MKKIIFYLFISFLCSAQLYANTSNKELYKNIDLFAEVLDKIKKEYVDVVDQSELIDDDFRDELIDKRSLSELKNKFEELNSMNWNYMTKAQKDLREKLANMIEFYNS